MPRPLKVNWEAIQTLAMAVGLKKAAEKTGVSYGAIRKRSSTEGWMKYSEAAMVEACHKPVTVAETAPYKEGKLQSVTPAPLAMAQIMAGYSGNTKLNLAVTADKLSQHFAGQAPEELVGQTPAIKDVAVIAKTAHDWGRDTGSQALVNITIGPSAAPASPVIDLEGL